jgi:hypothetical protein
MRRPAKPAALERRVFSARGVRAQDLLTAAQIRSSAWQRLHRGAYADAVVARGHGLLCVGAHLLMPPEAAIGGRSAAWAYGVKLLGEDARVEVVTPRAARFGPVSSLIIRLADLPEADIVPGRPAVTTPLRTAWDIARFYPPVESVPYLDAMAARRLVAVADLRARHAACTVAWGRKRAGTAIGLVDPSAESPQESRLRVRLAVAKMPPPVVQYEVYAGSRFVARVDLAWPDRRVAVEYDGVWHATSAQLHADRRRLNRLVTAGWTVLHVTSARLATDFPGFLSELRAALTR